MKNSEIVKILEEIADFLELKGENVFKTRAYQKAARSIEFLSEDVAKLVQENRLSEIPGVGEAITAKLTELITTGHLKYYEKLRDEFPPGISTFLNIPGIGPRTALLLTRELRITTIEELEQAIADGRVVGLSGMGEKTARNIQHQIQALRRKKSDKRVPIGNALPMAESIIESLNNIPGLANLTMAGSLRRFRDTIGDIDILGTCDNPEAVLDAFITLPQVSEVLEKGPTKASVIISAGIQVDLRLFKSDSFGAALQYSTGSKQHNVDLRKRAEKMGLSLSEYGITIMSTGQIETFTDEKSFYARQGLEYIPPEIREGIHEIELSEQRKLPRLLEIADIKGDLHVHSDWSDGMATLEEITAAARERGYEYIGITDHSAGLGIARGLNAKRILEQKQAIKELNEKQPDIRILTGIEANILADGTLDVVDEILADLDIVLASIHSGLNQSLEKLTQRIIKAIQNPHVDIIAHPTGRLIGEREAAEIDIDAIAKAAIQYGKALEINAMPARLDLKDIHIYKARTMGVKLLINTDSHQLNQLDYMRYGVGTARRGWCQAEDILNTLPWEKLRQYTAG
jgi:DNA polymerase (family X)